MKSPETVEDVETTAFFSNLHAERKKRCAAADSDEELIAMRACEIVSVFCVPKGILVVPVVSYHILLGDVFAVWYHVRGV